MKKILLGLISSLALISTTLYAACTTDVEMGGNKIKDLGAGTADGEAVNYAQTLKVTQTNLVASDNSTFQAETGFNVIPKVYKVGNMVCVSGRFRNISGADITSTTAIALLTSEYRPPVALDYYMSLHGSIGRVQVTQSGTIQYLADPAGSAIPNNTTIYLNGCWIK